MTSSVLPKKLVILAIVLPLAAFLGFQLADPTFKSWGLLMLLAGVLCIPLLLKWHHPLLILCWNLPMTMFFLPGNPSAWMLVGFASFGLSVLGTIMDKERRLIHVPMVTYSLLALCVVVVFTMKMTGEGLGLRSMGGSSYGGRKYFYVLFAAVACFATGCQRLPMASANRCTAFLFLPAAASSVSHFIYYLGPGMWFLYHLFPVDWAISQASDDFNSNPTDLRFGRLGGFGVAATAVFSYVLARHGIRGSFNLRKPWPALALVTASVVGLLGGFRSVVIIYTLLFMIQFFLEGLHRTRFLPVLLAVGLLGFLVLLPLTQKLPLSVQRCLTILPVEVHPAVKVDAKASTEWRLAMWRALAPEIPKYFWVGKGYAIQGADMYLAAMAERFGLREGYESSMASGDFHNGLLSILIPFGIWGVLAFLFFVGASLRVSYLNFRHGDPALKHINTFIFTALLTRVICFFFVFGAIHIDVPVIAALIGFSISLNGGVCRERSPSAEPAPKPAVATAARPRRWMPVRA